MLCIEVKPLEIPATTNGAEPPLFDRRLYPSGAGAYLVNKRHLVFCTGPDGSLVNVLLSSTSSPVVEISTLHDLDRKREAPAQLGAGIADETFLKSLALIVGGPGGAQAFLEK